MDQSPPETNYGLKDIGYFRATPRSLEDYLEIFSLTSSAFAKNAKILDIGSGTNQEFARGLKQERPDVSVVSLDPSLALPADPEKLKELRINYDLQDEGEIRQITSEETESRILDKWLSDPLLLKCG